MTAYRVRFAPRGKVSPNAVTPSVPAFHPFDNKSTLTRQKSRSGCRECRQRKVKCDETFPSCVRCQRRGSVCQPNLRTSDWHFEIPWLAYSPLTTVCLNSHPDIKVNARLMRYWLEATSQMLSVDPGNNPFSFPILKYATVSRSLVHFLQSASAAQEEYFHQPKLSVSLDERGKALIALREELESQSSPLSHSFLTLLMLGMSSSWMAMEPTEYGKEHLVVAQTVAEMVIKRKDSKKEELDHLTLGIYVYWDMACSFCLDPEDHPIDGDSSLKTYVKQARNRFHAITTHSIDLYYLLGRLGRYCRVVVDQGIRDLVYEANAEKNLKEYESIESDPAARSLTEAFRKHGLLLLHRFCGKPGVSECIFPAQVENENYVHDLAVDIIELLLQTESNSPYLNIQTIPLMSAGAEMTSLDGFKRDQIRHRLNEVYSTNRLLSTLWVIDLLEELWVLHDSGMTHITWLQLMLSKNWRLRIG
ncbi:unnamed protein product [Penicillium salamii]|uniref:Zn(2)-C6 fungal-type domain-containing protein n=1 Tax=Penicillium salamii TaxID=1612424 RepID=A0A9W4NAK1_9EURO|nr:unnamed protein product [Penicillium salamii]CAG8012394.1 unnamed protein product [Penicillium salamii]CAG8253946.1 unnamed protein product [Penicillium salamii]CAG8253954.1 unnamed protein product [Penicillium salamii]CAG8312464.1 unnamed protein product [Penicillium salamii]